MEKLTSKIAALPPGAIYFSLEFFPPKTQMVGSLTPALHLPYNGQDGLANHHFGSL